MKKLKSMHRSALGAAFTALLVVGGGCADTGLVGSQASADALARTVLDGLEARDRRALETLLVTREEHRDLLWSELPESNHLRFDVARELNVRNTREGLTRALDRFGGQRYELVAIEFTDAPEIYETFTLHRGTALRVRRSSDGREGNLPILDVVLERNGRWKLMNFEE
ncbi:MAG: hypothetical protein PVG79_15515 [Gemmatimonadales bacterium]|jgi:hypothetical protein